MSKSGGRGKSSSKSRGGGGGGHSGGRGGAGGRGGGGGQQHGHGSKKSGKSKSDYHQTSLRGQAHYRIDPEDPEQDRNRQDDEVNTNQSITTTSEYEETSLTDSLHATVFSVFSHYLQEQELSKFHVLPSQLDQASVFNIVRPMSCLLGLLSNPHGSAKLWQGNTCVVAVFYGPSDVRISKELPHRGVVDVIYRPKITGTSQSQMQTHDATILEERNIDNIVANIFESVIYLDEESAGSGFNIVLHEYENDGCVLSACINAATFAILDAAASIRNTVASVTAVLTRDYKLIIDPSSEQMKNGFSSMFIFAFTNDKKVLYTKCNGRQVSEKIFKFVLDECIKSSEEIFNYFEDLVKRKRGIVELRTIERIDTPEASNLEIEMEMISSSDDDDIEEEIEEITDDSSVHELDLELEDGEIED